MARWNDYRSAAGVKQVGDSVWSASAVGQLYVEHFERLVASLYAAFGAGPPEPEDVAQRAFAKLIGHRPTREVDNPAAFLWRTASNIAISDKRAQQVRHRYARDSRSMQNEGVVLTPERVLESKERLDVVLATLRKMPEQRRRVFLLNRVEGLSYSEVSKRIGIGRTAVTKHVARATADIDAALSKR
ncbi:MAG: sigma-70 family RNA polymerase sigma factor [Myxococcota bacterium]